MEKEMQERAEDETVWFRPGKAGMAARHREFISILFIALISLVIQINIHTDTSAEAWVLVVALPLAMVGWFWLARGWQREAIGISANKIVVVEGSGRCFEMMWADTRYAEVRFEKRALRIGAYEVAVMSTVEGAPLYDLDGLRKSLEARHLNPTALGTPNSGKGGAKFLGMVYLINAILLIIALSD